MKPLLMLAPLAAKLRTAPRPFWTGSMILCAGLLFFWLWKKSRSNGTRRITPMQSSGIPQPSAPNEANPTPPNQAVILSEASDMSPEASSLMLPSALGSFETPSPEKLAFKMEVLDAKLSEVIENADRDKRGRFRRKQ